MDIETRHFVQSFVRFLTQQIAADGLFSPDIVESLEVASQCLETAYNLPIDMPEYQSDMDGIVDDPMPHIDVRELFRATCSGHPQRKREAEEVKNEGNQLMRDGKYQEALSYYNRSIVLDPTNPVYYCNRAATYSRLGEFQKAADDCYMSLRYEPRYGKAYGRLGMAMSKLGHSEKALEAYRQALVLEPLNADYKTNLELAQQLHDEQQQPQPAPPPQQQPPPPQPQPTSTAGTGNATGGFQLPPNFAMPSMDTLQSVISQPGMQNLVQQMMGDPSQVDMLRNAFQAGGGATSAAGAGAGTDGSNGLAGLLGLLNNAGGLANIGNLMNQLNGGGGASNGHDPNREHHA